MSSALDKPQFHGRSPFLKGLFESNEKACVPVGATGTQAGLPAIIGERLKESLSSQVGTRSRRATGPDWDP
jgi:hypothetical protein